jgi:hypothetical protein
MPGAAGCPRFKRTGESADVVPEAVALPAVTVVGALYPEFAWLEALLALVTGGIFSSSDTCCMYMPSTSAMAIITTPRRSMVIYLFIRLHLHIL